MGNVIHHCGGWIPTEEEFKLADCPGVGDYEFVKRAKCKKCGHYAYAYRIQYQGSEDLSNWYNAPRVIAQRFNARLREGTGVTWIERKAKDGENTPTVFQQHASEYSMTINGRAEDVLHYLNKLERAARVVAV